MSKHTIISMLPGTFYRSASPGAPPIKEDGSEVGVNETIGIIEVMKTFHEIKSDSAGRIVFLADDEEPVMPGQPLAEVEA